MEERNPISLTATLPLHRRSSVSTAMPNLAVSLGYNHSTQARVVVYQRPQKREDDRSWLGRDYRSHQSHLLLA